METLDEIHAEEVDRWIAEFAHEDGQVRQKARKQVVERGSEVVPKLIEALDDERAVVRWEAAQALAALAAPESADALAHLLEDEDEGVRWLAAEGLVALGESGFQALLTALIHHGDSNDLRSGAHHVICGTKIWRLARMLAPVVGALERAAPEITVPIAAERALSELESGGPR